MKKINYTSTILYWSFIILILIGCQWQKDQQRQGFVEITAEYSGIAFNNEISVSDDFNYNTFPYIYMGGGVAIGDLNNDGLSDIYLVGNMVANRLYLNEGNLVFKDVSNESLTAGDKRWYTGVTMVDINADGWLDIYLSVSGMEGNTNNQLFVNNGDLTFTERAKEYGVADAGHSIQSAFFDYDNDGDLDLFVGNYPIIPLSQDNLYYYERMKAQNPDESGHLYENIGNGKFRDVTTQSGVLNFGLTLGVVVSDFNNDGWQDLYVSNDFNVPDYFYINNGDGTFSEQVKEATKQTSMFGMGVDAADFDNDGLIDLLQVDMTPANHYRAKTNMASMDQASFYNGVSMGFHYQYMQNSLQVNNGNNPQGIPIMSNIARLTGVATTDWSWGALFGDFDNDGFKDIFITNGMRLDVNNNDLLNSQQEMSIVNTGINMHNAPVTPIENFLFKNKGNYEFEDVSKKWSANTKGFSNGVAYGDLDNDGDLDLVINNIDARASILQNQSGEGNYLRIKLTGPPENTLAIGAKIKITVNGKSQWIEQHLSRGFQSSVEPICHFGLGDEEIIDQIAIVWPDGKMEYQEDIMPNQTIELKYSDAKKEQREETKNTLKFRDITSGLKIDFIHEEDMYNDYLVEPLLPHKNSELGPGLVVGDVNNDGLEDFYIGNARNRKGGLFLQAQDRTFKEEPGIWSTDSTYEDTGAVFFDADGDGDLDLYVVSGGNRIGVKKSEYQDRIYINTPQGFAKATNVLPEVNSSGLKVLPIDYNGDGLLDLFVGGRIEPGRYLQAPGSYILRNEGGTDANLRFKDVTMEVAPGLANVGMVTDALWQDFNNDGNTDLILVGEWMPITFFENDGHILKNVTYDLGFEDTVGWWYSLASTDMDNDGDLDLFVGNLGHNSKYKTSDEAPFEVFVNDFDENNRSDIVLSVTKNGKKLPLRGRECSSQQIPKIKANFKTYDDFAKASLDEIYGSGMLSNSLHFKANTFAHLWFENIGKGQFVRHSLPVKAQFSTVNDIVFFDYNDDEYPDVLIAGNLYDTEVETPRADAGIGLVLQNIGGKAFEAIPMNESGLLIDSEVKAIHLIQLGEKDQRAFLVASNNDRLVVFAN
ncbi:MAG: VCBS repeat-containing protein [Cyclobacteriaceae bacterium]